MLTWFIFPPIWIVEFLTPNISTECEISVSSSRTMIG